MDRRFWYRTSLVALLAGCAPGGGLTPGNNAPLPAPLSVVHGSASATVIIRLPPIHKAGTPIDWSTNSLSSATRTATLFIGSERFGPIALTASNKNCSAKSAGLTCTLVVTVRPGTYKQVVVETYASGIKGALANGHTPKRSTVSFFAGRNTVSLEVDGIARTLKVIPANKTVTQGQYSFDPISVETFDAAHLQIPSRYTLSPRLHYFAIGLRFSGFFEGKSSEYSSYYYDCCANSFPYDGLAVGTETVTAYAFFPYERNSVSIPDASAAVKAVAGSSAFAPLMFGIRIPLQAGFLPGMVQLATGSSASSAPVRQFFNSYRDPAKTSSYDPARWPIYGEDTSGDFWIGNVELSNSLAVLGAVTLPSNVTHAIARDAKGHLYAQAALSSGEGCATYEFPHRYGTVKAIREIDGPCGPIATDGAGNVYVADEFQVPGSSGYSGAFGVQEYPPKGSGHIAPIRSMVLKQDGAEGNTAIGLDVDDAGNVYLAANLTDYSGRPPSQEVYKFAPGATSGTAQLGGLKVDGFAVDGTGDIYAVVTLSGEGYSEVTAVEEFAPGATTPMQTFGGTAGASYGSPILLPRFPP